MKNRQGKKATRIRARISQVRSVSRSTPGADGREWYPISKPLSQVAARFKLSGPILPTYFDPATDEFRTLFWLVPITNSESDFIAAKKAYRMAAERGEPVPWFVQSPNGATVVWEPIPRDAVQAAKVTEHWSSTLMRREQGPARAAGRPKKVPDQVIRDVHKSTGGRLSLTRYAQRVGLSKSAMHRRLKELGLRTPGM